MSTNINFKATRDIQVVKTGQIEKQTEYFENVWQTPTVVTDAIVSNPNPIKAYKDWVMTGCEDVVEDIFDEDDIFCDGPVIDQRTVNYGAKQCQELDEWISSMTDRGFEITPGSW